MKKAMYVILVMTLLVLGVGCSSLKIFQAGSSALPNGFKAVPNKAIVYSEFDSYYMFRPSFTTFISKNEYNQLFLDVLKGKGNEKYIRLQSAMIDVSIDKFDKVVLKNDKNQIFEVFIDETGRKVDKKHKFIQGQQILLPSQISEITNFVNNSNLIKGYFVNQEKEIEIPTPAKVAEEMKIMLDFYSNDVDKFNK
ncbi:MAG: hypothetical protein KA157_05215 [Aliarcobacter sp.]|nr:hypothetical protein [Aliarcobacter sp.]